MANVVFLNKDKFKYISNIKNITEPRIQQNYDIVWPSTPIASWQLCFFVYLSFCYVIVVCKPLSRFHSWR